jgi:hypothetical protein
MGKNWQWLVIGACGLAFLVLSSHWWLLYGGPVRGSVLDASTSRPLPNTMVVVKWIGSMSGVHGASYPCYHVVLTKTGEDGHFYVPFWWKQTYAGANSWAQGIWTTTVERPIEYAAYRPGYVMTQPVYPMGRGDDFNIRMEPFTGATQERLSYLAGPFNREIACSAYEESLLPIYEAAYAEAKAIARSAVEQELLDTILTGLESIQYGNSAALSRKGARRWQRMEEQRRGRTN